MIEGREFLAPYTGTHARMVGFPLGGVGAGMICLEGTGGFNHVSVRHRPRVWHQPNLFAAVRVHGETPWTRVLEGQMPDWRVFGPQPANTPWGQSGNGLHGKFFGFPRYDQAVFDARFPFATVELAHADSPLGVRITGWSPFTPGDADASSLPVAAVEYTLTNTTDAPLDAVFSFHAEHFLAQGEAPRGVRRTAGGFTLWQQGSADQPWDEGALTVEVDAEDAGVDCRWFRGTLGGFETPTMLWQAIAGGTVREAAPYVSGEPSPGGSIYLPVTLAPGAARTITVRLSWYVPLSDMRVGSEEPTCGGDCCCATPEPVKPTHRPWYAGQFPDADAVAAYWQAHCAALRAQSAAFRDTFFASTLPAEVLEAVSANLSILKSPTVLRQPDGRLWCWEGCCEGTGCCNGSCTHVWNYAQALAHLFPDLERTLRQTEFFENQDARGHQTFRANLPIRPETAHDFHAAADGQLGGIIKVYRDWRISGDTAWLRRLWPRVAQSLAYCIDTWDPAHKGCLEEPHHNTYDIEFWGPDGMCTSFYLGALLAACKMAEAVGEDRPLYARLYARGRAYMETALYNGEYFYQRICWEGLRAGDPTAPNVNGLNSYADEALELLRREGPKFQYGEGCLADGVLGSWLAEVSGLGEILAPEKVAAHLRAVHRYNLRHDLSDHVNPQRAGYGLGHEGGLLMCTWPRGHALSLPFLYSNEVWTGVEYQVAAHLIAIGEVAAGLDIVREARRRYDGRVRNPFDEYECGHWYGRALSSYALLGALSGARYDAVDRVLYLAPQVPGDFQAFLATATGYGLVGVRDGAPFMDVRAGEIVVERIAYSACAEVV